MLPILLVGQDTLTLKESYESSFKIGTAVNPWILSGRIPEANAILIDQFNTITIENSLKAGPVNPNPGEYHFEGGDQFVAFGEEHGMFIVGHTLVWHNQTPDWFFFNEDGSKKSKEEVRARIEEHIKTVAGRYSGRIHAWDVVNEVMGEDGNYRPTTWVEGIGDGDELVKLAFQYAEKYAPDTELYYNDFNAWRPEKRDGIMRMVRMLQKESIRIDGIGIQGHWGLNFPKNEYIEAAIDSFSSLGVKVMITELDVDVLPLTKEGQIIGQAFRHPQFQLEEFETFLDPYKEGLPEEIANQLANRYRELFEIFYQKRDKIDRVTFWGIQDGMSWKNGYPIPGRTNYPLLWNREYKPKKAFEAVLSVPK